VPGVNNFTDWTAEEIARLKSRNSGNSPNVLPTPAEPSKDEEYISVGVPLTLDWRALKAVTSVKNQGDCGSCWAFGVAGYVESKLIIERGYNQTIDLSEQYLVSCTPNSDCKGGWP
jgi:C1A family cysteine protease